MNSPQIETLEHITDDNKAQFNREKYEKLGKEDEDRFFMNFGYNGYFSPYIYATLIEYMKRSMLTGELTKDIMPLRILYTGPGSGYFPFILTALGKSMRAITLDINSHLIPTQQAVLNTRPDIQAGKAQLRLSL